MNSSHVSVNDNYEIRVPPSSFRRLARAAAASAVILLLFLSVGCHHDVAPTNADGQQTATATESIEIIVSSEPWHSVVQTLVGDFAAVKLLSVDSEQGVVGRPTADQIARLQSADLVIVNGANQEPWLDLVTVARSRLLVMTDSIRAELLTSSEVLVHQHGPSGEQSDDALLPATWHDPQLAVQQVKSLQHRLTRLLPDAAQQIEEEASQLEQQLLMLDDEIQKLSDRFPSVRVQVQGHDLAYLWKRLGWKVERSEGSPANQRSDSSSVPQTASSVAVRLVRSSGDAAGDGSSTAVTTTLQTCDVMHGEGGANHDLVAFLSQNVGQLQQALQNSNSE